MGVRSKRYKGVKGLIEVTKSYSIKEAVGLIKKSKKLKFDETIDIAINLGVDPKHADQIVKGVVKLPYGTGKVIKIAVFAKDEKAKEAKDSGADFIGAEDLAEKFEKGELKVDRVIATPDMMSIVGKLGKVLGPKGLMPNPKLGTVTNEIGKAVKDAKSGQVKFKNEKSGIVHAGIGKLSFKDEDILSNLKTFYSSINKSKPDAVKGAFIKKVTIASTMGVGLKINQSSLR